ncbi:MFS transporter [Dactylosporangium sp. NPDC000521]|uniref:MFS transporter n=1 Tax=Dactylosporangium sp. NPDC000521 TaxID=3363975 RepID=UPI0036811C3F
MGAGFVSVSGTWMQSLAVNWYVLQATGSAGLMGLTVLLQSLPVLLLSPWAGAIADRLPGRPLLLCTQLIHAALAASLAAVTWSHVGGLGLVYAISAVGGVVNAVEGPAMGRFGSTIVAPAALTNALSLGSLVNSCGRILGMALGGIAAATVGPALLFAANAASFLGVVIALLAIRPHHGVSGAATAPPHGRSLSSSVHDVEVAIAHGVRAGLQYLLRQPVILITLGLATVLGSLGRNYQVTMAAMSKGPLHIGPSGYGLLSMCFAVGTVLGSLIAAWRSDLGYQTLIGTGLATSLLQLFSGLSIGVWSFAATMLLIGAGAVLIDTTVSARVQLDTHTEMRGRMLAAMSVTGSLAGALGAPLLGWLSEWVGPRQTLVMAGALTAAACIAAGMALKGARHRWPAPVHPEPAAS